MQLSMKIKMIWISTRLDDAHDSTTDAMEENDIDIEDMQTKEIEDSLKEFDAMKRKYERSKLKLSKLKNKLQTKEGKLKEYEAQIAELQSENEKMKENQYEIKAFHGKKVDNEGDVWYLAEWKNYPLSVCTWQNVKGMNADDLIKEFEDQLKRNKNTHCTKHGSIKSVVPCWRHKKCNNVGLEDLTSHGVIYN